MCKFGNAPSAAGGLFTVANKVILFGDNAQAHLGVSVHPDANWCTLYGLLKVPYLSFSRITR